MNTNPFDQIGRLIIVSGGYGAGKSECSIALSLELKERSPAEPITLIDLDIVNPYFRSREARSVLERHGIRVIGNSLGIDTGVDLPAIPATVAPALSDASTRVVVDLGGDPVGARVLRRFRPSVPTEDTTLLYVFNRYREYGASIERTTEMLRAIENTVGLEVSGIVNNSHLLSETTCDVIVEGDRVCRDVAERLGLPVLFRFAVPSVLRTCPAELGGYPLAIRAALRKPWMDGDGGRTADRESSRPGRYGAGRSDNTVPRSGTSQTERKQGGSDGESDRNV